MSQAWAGGSTRRWRRIRAQVLTRDHCTCQLKLTGICTGAAEHVHHVLGRAVTGDDPAYLVAACEACNLALGQPGTRTPDPQPRKMTQW